ncbi:MAG: DUF4214 domain-containing protein [Defluviitaleaceae bacterium]|nr:DUF4214 domain-containing protein [Defluviitaleaceae bacterium]
MYIKKFAAAVLTLCLTLGLFTAAYADVRNVSPGAGVAMADGEAPPDNAPDSEPAGDISAPAGTPGPGDAQTDTSSDTAGPDSAADTQAAMGMPRVDPSQEYDIAPAPDDQTPAMAAPAISGGGTAASPYLVTSEAQLLAISQGSYTNNYTAYYKLQNNIALTSANWPPIGGNGKPVFSGTFDGNGYTISNVQIPAGSAYQYSGLFGYNTGTIKNLGVTGRVTAWATANYWTFAGVLVGYNNGIIQRCYSGGAVTGPAYWTGYYGGLAGYAYGGLIENCYSMASVSNPNGNATGIGGLAGYNYGGTIQYCYAAGLVSSSSPFAGGLLGVNANSGVITSCYYDLAATGRSDTGKGAPCSTAAMKNKNNYAAWNFSAIWGIAPNTNNGYPYLTVIVGSPSVTAVVQFVTRLYQYVLGRAPDAGGLNYWYTGLVNRTLTGAQATANFFFCSEFVNKNVSDTAFLTDLYNACMGRAPDASGMAYWKGMIAKGWSRKYIVSQFMASAEFKGICASYGITAGSVAVGNTELKPGVTAFVTRLYTIFMSRTPDSAGLNFWCGQIVLKGVSPKTAAATFVNSTEFQNRRLTNAQYVTCLYNGLLGRAPDTAGLNYWVALIGANLSARQTLLKQFLNSAEFAGICASFGL